MTKYRIQRYDDVRCPHCIIWKTEDYKDEVYLCAIAYGHSEHQALQDARDIMDAMVLMDQIKKIKEVREENRNCHNMDSLDIVLEILNKVAK